MLQLVLISSSISYWSLCISTAGVTRNNRKHRQYTYEFKAQLLAESQSSRSTVARIVLENDSSLDVGLPEQFLLIEKLKKSTQ